MLHLEPDITLTRRFFRLTSYLMATVMTIGVLVLVGWLFDIYFFKHPFPGLSAMNPMSAVLFVLATSCFFLVKKKLPAASLQRSIATMIMLFIIVVAVLRIIDIFTTYDIPVDRLLFANQLASEGMDGLPNNMAPNTAISFVLAGICLLLLHYEDRHQQIPVQYLAMIIALLGFFSVLGYLYRVEAFYGVFTYVPMAIHTAGCFFLFALALFFTHPDKGMMLVFTSKLTGSSVARLLIPITIIVPVILGFLRLQGQWSGIFSVEFGVTILVLSIIIAFLFILWHNIKLLNKRDLQRILIEENVKRNAILMENISEAIIATDTSFGITTWNKYAEELYGWTAAEAIGKNVGKLLQIKYINKNEKEVYNEFKVNGYWRGEVQHFSKSGKSLHVVVTTSAIMNNDGKPSGAIAVIRDISATRALEQQLKKFNEELEEQVRIKTAELTGIFERISDGFIALDKDFNYIYVNKRTGEMVHRDPQDLVGKNVWDEFPDAVGSASYYAFHRALREQVYVMNTDYFEPLDLWQENHIYPTQQGLSVFIRDITVRKKAELELKRSNIELRQLASHIQNVREKEQTRIAREIHDELGQQLTGLKMDTSWLLKKMMATGDPVWLDKLNSMKMMLDMAIQTVRKIASELRPSILDDMGLIAALSWRNTEFEKRYEITVDFQALSTDENIDPRVTIAVFRMYQEALTNIARHANASRVETVFEITDNRIRLSVTDNGDGFDKNDTFSKRTSLGLVGMKERAYAIGGSVVIKSEAGKGTTVLIAAPLQSAESDL